MEHTNTRGVGTEGEATIRLTKNVIQRLLDQNEGYSDQTYYKGKNFREQRDYEIREGALHVRSRGRTSWADSDFDEQFLADDQQARRFLRNNLHALNTYGLDTPVARDVAARRREDAVPPGGGSWGDLAEEPTLLLGREGADDDDCEDPEMDRAYAVVAGAVIAFLTVLAVAPHAKRWWSESLAPRAKRMRGKGTKGEPADNAGD